MEYSIRVNRKVFTVDVDPQKPLLWVLREDIGLCGTKYSCGIGLCGSCTVLVDGVPSPSCTIPVEDLGKSTVTTIEGLNNRVGRAVKRAWITEQVSQCGYCQPGQIIKATYLLSTHAEPSDELISETMTWQLR